MIEIELPDGTIAEFPDGTPQATIKAALRRRFPAASQQSTLGGVVDAATNALTFGFGDEITAAEAAVLGRTPEGGVFDFSQPIGERFNRALEAERGQQAQFREQNPRTAIGAEIGSLVAAAPLLPVVAPFKAAGTARAIGNAGATGATFGALFGAGSADGGIQNRAEGAAQGAALGFGTGAVLGSAAQGIRNAITRRSAAKAAGAAAPTSDQLRRTATALFEGARNSGVEVAPRSFVKFFGNLAGRVRDDGIDPTIHPKATAALTRLRQLAETNSPLNFRELQTIRRVLGSAAKSREPDEARIASKMIAALDDYVDSLGAQDLATGTSRAATGAAEQLRQARALWSRLSKSQTIEEVIERAASRRSSFDVALRNEAGNLERSKSRLRGFNASERELVRQLAKGTPTERVLELAGKAAPTGIVSSVLSGGAGFAAGGAPGAVGLLAAGKGAQVGSQALARRNAELIAALLRSGPEASAKIPAAAQGRFGPRTGLLPIPAEVAISNNAKRKRR